MKNSILYDRSTTLPDERNHFHRPRIDKIIAKAFTYPLVTVTAGAGWGKTQAISSFLHRTDIDFVWHKLSKLDNLTPRFWGTFVYAVGMYNPEFSALLSDFGFPYSLALFNELLHVFADFTADTKQIIFIFDDFHLVNEPRIIRFIENLLWARLTNLTVVLIGRSRPMLNLQGLYSDDFTYPITEADLRFTKDETKGYFKQQDIVLSKSAFDELYAKTDGWISVLYLICLSLQKRDCSIQEALIIAEQQIFELIEREIFSRYSEKTKRILIELSFFEKIPYDVIKEYAADNLNLIEEIEKTNLFIHFNPSTNTYNMHHLFLDFLGKKQLLLTDYELKNAHLKAAQWYDAHNSKLDALSHYQECEHYEEIWDIIYNYDYDPTLPTDIAILFMELIESFPQQLIGKNPLILVVHARLLLNNGKIKESEQEFLTIIQKYENLSPCADNRAVAGEAYIFMGMISMLSLDYRFVEYYKKADTYLPNGSTLVDSRFSFNQGYYTILIRDSAPNEVNRYVTAIMEAMPHGVKAMNGGGYGVKYLTKAEAAYFMCDTKEAESCSYKAIYQAEKNRQLDTICAAYSLLIRIYIYAGNYTKAAACLEKWEEKIKDPQNSMYIKYCMISQDMMMGWYYIKLGAYEKVPGWLLKEDERNKIVSPNSLGKDQLIRACYLLETENYYEFSALLEVLEDYYNHQGLLLGRLGIQVYKSVAAHKTGDDSKSMEALKKAYDLAVDNELYMHFIELGKHMRAIIHAAKQSKENTVPDTWLDMINAKANTYEKQLGNVKAQYRKSLGLNTRARYNFTKREQEVLQHLYHGLTNKEIADSLYISTSTVKQTLTNIYTKLGATSKADAIRIVMQMDLSEK